MTSTAGTSVIDHVAVDDSGRIFVLGATGHVFVLSSSGATLSEWNARPPDSSHGVALTVGAGGEVFAVDTVAGAVARWTWDGQLIARWEAPLNGVYAMNVASDGSVLVRDLEGQSAQHLRRFSPEGRFIGWIPGRAGASQVFTSHGRMWTVSSSTIAGMEANGRPFVSVGVDCPIGGDPPAGACWFGLGTFNPAGRPLYMAATLDGGVIVADSGANRLQAFTATGRLRFACTKPVAGETPIAVASRHDTLVLATRSVLTTQTSLYTARLRAGADVACRQSPLRLSNVRIRRQGGHVKLTFALSKRARTMITLIKQQVRGCAADGLAPITPHESCVALGAVHSLPERRRTRGRHTMLLAHCRKPLPCLAHGTWLVAVRAVDRDGNEADAAWQTARF